VIRITTGYHGTSPKNVSRILTEGLRFPKPSFGNCGETIWLALQIEGARSSGSCIFEVDFEGLRGGWYDDSPVIWQAHIFEEIPPERLKLVEIAGHRANDLFYPVGEVR